MADFGAVLRLHWVSCIGILIYINSLSQIYQVNQRKSQVQMIFFLVQLRKFNPKKPLKTLVFKREHTARCHRGCVQGLIYVNVDRDLVE